MKRYGIFRYETFYPCGGWNDFMGAYETLEEAQKVINNEALSEDEKFMRSINAGKHFQIVDLLNLEVIEGDDDPSYLREEFNGNN